MDYKRRIGHRVLPRADFLTLLRKHSGPFSSPADSGGGGGGDGGCCDLALGTLVELTGLKARPELNGRHGVVAGPPEPPASSGASGGVSSGASKSGISGRYPVRLAKDPKTTCDCPTVAIQRENLIVAAVRGGGDGPSGLPSGFTPLADGDEADIGALLR